jgi:uncharacterized protein (DUF58 family)
MKSSQASSYRFIDPHVLAAIADLHLLTKTVVDGFMLGANQSPRPGVGLEFNQYRSYQPGDDLRRIDWKMYARSDRYFVRESEIETSITVQFVLDASASMMHEEQGIAKFNYARFLIAALGYLANMQGEAIGLDAVSDETITHIPAKRDHQQLHRFLHELERLRPRGRWPGWKNLESGFNAEQKRGMIVFVTDMHEEENEITAVLSKLSALKNEVLLFNIIGRNEIDFLYEGALTFEDLETGKSVQVDALRARKSYLAAMQNKLRVMKQTLHNLGITNELFVIDQPLDFALRTYLTQRMKLA